MVQTKSRSQSSTKGKTILRCAAAVAASFGYKAQGADWNLSEHGVDPEARFQSPIDIPKNACEKVSWNKKPSVKFDYTKTPSAYLVTNKRPSIVQVIAHPTLADLSLGKCTVDGKVFEAIEFHFHAPGEHTFDGKRHALEMHIVHKLSQSESGATPVAAEASGLKKDELLVVGVTFTASPQANSCAFLTKLLAQKDFPPIEGESITIKAPRGSPKQLPVSSTPTLARQNDTVADLGRQLPFFDYTSLICKSDQKSCELYRYSGSLTTPPCSEGVNWFVVADPIVVPEAQLAPFHTLKPPASLGTYREIQGRGVPAMSNSQQLSDYRQGVTAPDSEPHRFVEKVMAVFKSPKPVTP